ncbi:DNA (cytosine-5-)-methyltransferase [Aeromonas jandaei]|uniref:DNA (cytosine-5-)-methyltransferase n=1 Tax=Aeromonas jandaei TaxID=650 RepID=UPI001EED64E9|nr:DNA (cytosine-5-)-methyltransferase [Aeromonas jandaei]
MKTFLKKYEDALSALAHEHTPTGSDPRALIHQWLHAIASDTELACQSAKINKEIIISELTKHDLIASPSELKTTLHSLVVSPPSDKNDFTFIDLFAGIGGFRTALQSLGGVCTFSSEWDKSAQQTYLNNYGELPFGDITAFTNDNISDKHLNTLVPSHDILAAGFPCQPFSGAGVSARNAVGKEHGFKCETQGTLFFDVMRIASVKKPKVLFLENVRNITRHDKGRTFDVIKRSVEEIGYTFKYELIDSSSLVPQRRVRCYMVCTRNDLNIDFKFPEFDGQPLPLRSILEPTPDARFTISDALWQGHIKRTERNLDRGTGFTAFTANLDKPSNTLVARYGKDGKECLIPQEGKNPRLLTPRECARLQGYPENFVIPTAKTPAYKQFGNSVAVPVIRKIAEKIVEAII